MAIGPLELPGGSPARVSGVKPLGAPHIAPTAFKLPHQIKPNRRLGAKKTGRMAFTPPGKIGAFHDFSDSQES